MADPGTRTPDPAVASDGRRNGDRGIRRSRPLPGGRAVVGALLVAAAAVGVFAAFLSATAEPGTRYAVAVDDVEVGTRLASDAEVARYWDFVPLDLPEQLAGRAVAEEQAPQLVGQRVTSPVHAGDLLLASAIVADGDAPATEKLSFSVPTSDAVGGALQPGERIDVLATYGSGADAWTAFVVRGALLVDAVGPDGTVAGGDETTLTVALSSLEDVQALGHAVRAADVLVTRSTVEEDADVEAPGPYTPDRGAAGGPASAGLAGDGGGD